MSGSTITKCQCVEPVRIAAWLSSGRNCSSTGLPLRSVPLEAAVALAFGTLDVALGTASDQVSSFFDWENLPFRFPTVSHQNRDYLANGNRRRRGGWRLT